MTTKVCASWSDGEAFRGLWEPLPDAEEFLLASCYVSQQGWEQLEGMLGKHLPRAGFRCTLIFSLAGLGESSALFVVNRLYALIGDERWKGRVTGYVLNDKGAALFHPKAHGSRRGMSTKVVIGSANLTASGMGSNFELMCVIEDDHGAYESFRGAIDGLAKSKVVRVDAKTIDDLRNSLAASAIVERAKAEQRRQLPKIKGHPQPDLPSTKHDLLLPANPDYVEALAAVRRLASHGGQLARLDQLEQLNIPVPLTRFREAGLLATSKAQEIGAGLSYDTGGRSISVSLLPSQLRKRLAAMTSPLGRLVGRFSIEMLGVRWMPSAWQDRLEEHWSRTLDSVDLGAAEKEITAHVAQLKKDLESGAMTEKLAERLEVESPAKWNQHRVRDVLEWSYDRPWPVKLTQKLQQEVVATVLDHVTRTVGRRLTADFPIMQLRQAGRVPVLRAIPPETIDIDYALGFLAEWALAGVGPRLRSATGDHVKAPGRSWVVELLAKRFDAEQFNPVEVFETALRWQNAELAGGPTQEKVRALLVEAWTSFVRWFGITPETVPWEQNPPSWKAKGEA